MSRLDRLLERSNHWHAVLTAAIIGIISVLAFFRTTNRLSDYRATAARTLAVIAEEMERELVSAVDRLKRVEQKLKEPHYSATPEPVTPADRVCTGPVIQRCQLHKIRNLQSHLPNNRHAYVLGTMREAYRSATVGVARTRLQALVGWLERSGYEEAARSLREGLEETLAVLKLELPDALRRSLATSNAVENLMGSIRRVSRNVRRWKNPEMIRRWTALGIDSAQKRFRRVKGYREMSALRRALRGIPESVDSATVVA